MSKKDPGLPPPRPAFRCPLCKRVYGDALYHGPWPHAPASLCLDCWAHQWFLFEQRIAREGDWSVLDHALWLICHGFTHSEAASLIGRHRNTLSNWIRRLRKFPHLVPDWLATRTNRYS